MSQSSTITLVTKSTQATILLSDILHLLNYYQEITKKAGEQLEWNYEERAFPYVIKQINQQPVPILHLTSSTDRYKEIYIGVKNARTNSEVDADQIFIALTNHSTYGDKNKATEFAKFFAKKYEGELCLFNGRIMYYNKR